MSDGITITLPWPPAELSPNARGPWTDEEINLLKTGIESGMSHKQIADAIGRSVNAVRGRAHLVGIVRDRFWPQKEVEELRDLYTNAGPDGVVDLEGFSRRVGRDASNVCRKATQLGLPVSTTRKKVEQRKDRRVFKGDKAALLAHASSRMQQWIKENGHPRGALGIKHTPAAIRKISEKSRAQAAAMTPERQAQINMKIMKTREANGTYANARPHATWKAAWHEIGGQRKYFRSNWEANYARYLQWLKECGHIADWKHEPKTFWFEGIKRGTVSYLPDFWVLENDGTDSFHEVKGWMDDRSKTKIARMAKYYPGVKLVVIDAKAYKEIRRKVSSLVPGWQDVDRDKRG